MATWRSTNPAERAPRGVANGLNPQLYMTDVLTRIADHPARQIAELLPWNWQLANTDRHRRLIRRLRRALTIDAHDNLILCGPTGVGKT